VNLIKTYENIKKKIKEVGLWLYGLSQNKKNIILLD